MNEFKFSTLRQFGSENVSFTATIHSDKPALSDEEIGAQIAQIDKVIEKSFRAVQEREIKEKDVLAESADRRREAVKKLDAALREEIAARKDAEKTVQEAKRLSK